MEKLFEVRIKSDTIKKRAEREKNNLGTNVPKESKDAPPPISTVFNSRSEKGGKREGAGRKMSQKTAWENAEKRLSKVVHYMMERCETPADIDDVVIRRIKNDADTLIFFTEEAKTGKDV